MAPQLGDYPIVNNGFPIRTADGIPVLLVYGGIPDRLASVYHKMDLEGSINVTAQFDQGLSLPNETYKANVSFKRFWFGDRKERVIKFEQLELRWQAPDDIIQANANQELNTYITISKNDGPPQGDSRIVGSIYNIVGTDNKQLEGNKLELLSEVHKGADHLSLRFKYSDLLPSKMTPEDLIVLKWVQHPAGIGEWLPCEGNEKPTILSQEEALEVKTPNFSWFALALNR